MSAITSKISSVSIVCSTVGSGADQRKHQSSAPLAFVRGIHLWPVNAPCKRPVTRKMFPFDDVIMPPCFINVMIYATSYYIWQSYKTTRDGNGNKLILSWFASLSILKPWQKASSASWALIHAIAAIAVNRFNPTTGMDFALIHDSSDHSFHGGVGNTVSITVHYHCILVKEWFIKQRPYTKKYSKRWKIMQFAASTHLHNSLTMYLPNGQQIVEWKYEILWNVEVSSSLGLCL